MSSSFHTLPYPALEEGNTSYPNGVYVGEVKSLGDSNAVTVTHRLENAGFIAQQINMGRAEYGCLLSVPNTGYRVLRRTSTPKQDVDWDLGIVGEPPFIRPIIVATQEFEHTFTQSCDVAEIWVGRSVKIPKGARLARNTFLRSQDQSTHSLLNIKPEAKLAPGSFYVRSDSSAGYMFSVYVASDIADFLANPGLDDRLRGSIGSHMVSSCFNILRQEFGNPDESTTSHKEYSNLRMLEDVFENEGILLWTDSEFNPTHAATSLHRILLPAPSDDGGE